MTKATAAAEMRAVSICLSADDLERLDTIRRASFVDSRSRAARIALARWHDRWLLTRPMDRKSRHPPELSEKMSPQTGCITTKFYFSAEDDKRLGRLKAWTGEQVAGRLIRAAIGWYASRV